MEKKETVISTTKQNIYGGGLVLSASSGQIQQAVTSFMQCLFIRHNFFTPISSIFFSEFSSK
jgi:hypothetical protein